MRRGIDVVVYAGVVVGRSRFLEMLVWDTLVLLATS